MGLRNITNRTHFFIDQKPGFFEKTRFLGPSIITYVVTYDEIAMLSKNSLKEENARSFQGSGRLGELQ